MAAADLSDVPYYGLYFVGGLAIAYGAFNLSAKCLRPYHRDFIGEQAPDVVARFFLKALKIVGILVLAYGVVIISRTASPMRRHEHWAWILLSALNFGVLPGLTFIAYSISPRSPWKITATAWLIFTLCLLSLRPS